LWRRLRICACNLFAARQSRAKGDLVPGKIGTQGHILFGAGEGQAMPRVTRSISLGGMKSLPLSRVYQLLEPGPVVLLATASKGRANVMTMSWHMMVDFEPPLVACVVSDNNYSFAALKVVKQCVIAIPALELASKVVRIGNCSGRDVQKFQKFGLRALRGSLVAAPLIADCFANLECKVIDTHLVSRFNLFVLEVIKAWIDPGQRAVKTIHHHGHGRFVVDGRAITLRSRMP
jgi:flavin reductase (DIM6/NTAB) family NADH-FMN oxidoreductase RutF